jgi:CRP-like cAMP-binding protein
MVIPVAPAANHLLEALPTPALEAYMPHLELVELDKGIVLAEPGVHPEFAYFPVDSVLLSLFLTRNGACTGTSLVGREGMLGVTLLLGGHAMPERSQVLYPGRAYRLPANLLGTRHAVDPESLRILLQQVQSLIVQLSLIAACTRHHSIPERLSRFLLMSLDRLPSSTVPATQEVIAQILGVRRESVTEAINKLEQQGVVNCRRGCITVLDRARLEESSCECYSLVQVEGGKLTPALPEPFPSAWYDAATAALH